MAKMENKLNAKENNKEVKLRKLMKFLIAFLAVITFLTITLKQYTNEKFGVDNVQNLIGVEYAGGEALTVRENLILQAALDAYIQAIYSGDITRAYGYVYPKYKEIVSLEVFENQMKEIGYENFVIEKLEIEQETDKMFCYNISIKNENQLQILIILDKENYYIVPEPFLEYVKVDEKISKKGLTYVLNGYQVDLNRCIFDMTITNNQDEEAKIMQAKMNSATGGSYRALNAEITIPAHATKEVSIICETHLDFPASFEITRNDNEKIRVYTFQLD